MVNGRVSVVIPTYNRKKFVARAIRSVYMQTYGDVEIVVVDDGSSDGTGPAIVEISREAPAGHRVRYVHQENAGACTARNTGMRLSSGAYMMFLDSDDLIKPTLIEQQVNKIEGERSQCSICDFECVDENLSLLRIVKNDLAPAEFIRSAQSPHISSIMMRRDSMPTHLEWNTLLKRMQDVDFAFKYLIGISRWSRVRQPLFQYCLHTGDRISDSYRDGMQYNLLRKSFREYVTTYEGVLGTASRSISSAYARALWKREVKDAFAKFTPTALRRLRKRILRPGVR